MKFIKALLLSSLFIASYEIVALDMKDVNQVIDSGKSLANDGKEWLLYQKCMLAAKMSDNPEEKEKKCFCELIDMKNRRIRDLEDEVARLKANQN